MMARSIYRSTYGQQALYARYDAALAALQPSATSIWIETTAGRTHILAMGLIDAPPLLIIPGGNILNPTSLSWFSPLASRYRLYAPDLPGQPGFSSQTPLATSGDAPGRWLAEILTGLGVNRGPIVGITYGAGLALRLAGYAPERITALGLVVPSGLVRGPLVPLVHTLLLPLLAYRIAPGPRRLARATMPLLSEPDPALAAEIGRSYRFLRLDRHLPRYARAHEVRHLRAPVLLIAGADDPFFPGAAVIARGRSSPILSRR